MPDMNIPFKIWEPAAAGFAAVFFCALLAIAPPAEAGTEIGKTLSGNYLAGRHAQTKRDLSAAADFLGAALNKAPESPDLVRRTFVLMIVEGRIREAESHPAVAPGDRQTSRRQGIAAECGTYIAPPSHCATRGSCCQ